MFKTTDLGNLEVDGVFCISIRERSDRRSLFNSEFACSQLPIEFLLVERDSECPERGCFTSHAACAQLALKRGYQRVLILEDDATLVPFKLTQVSQINAFLSRHEPELFYLGANLGKVWLTWCRGIARVRAKGTHAYILSRAGCERLVSHAPYAGEAIDKVFSKGFKAFMAFPMLSQQQSENLAPSDIVTSRSLDGTYPDDAFWKANWRKQYIQVLKNIGKTLLYRDM
ncbi:glycosyltransferase family 25 protein [Pseudomonas sp. S44]|uniref:glycosyltransferase family 25 protein n=1 Tax=Pseudomonas sp. S44 TaxID=2767450 RepID=UPI001909C734|nr:glycosyltransferase family 25 protein [Pseudomonas sp. S44]MBK0057484.1 glycosyltransferase family 25 protein [Pseudomonas sp. S44]